MKSKGEKEAAISKEEAAESWCFFCKDGGVLRICDNKQCLKSYHPRCVEKDDSFLESDDYWACDWHKCSYCSKSSYHRCYTCSYAVCNGCIQSADFLQIKGKCGFCNYCLKLALLIEENKDVDSDGVKVDFTDRNTYECLYMEYYNIIKSEEGFSLDDIRVAQDRLNSRKGYGTEESDDEDQISDYDGSEHNKKNKKKTRKEKRSVRHKSTTPTPKKSNKHEFIGWASKSLADFLSSIGESTDQELSQRDVTAIINEYVKENKLINPERRKMIVCDEQLQFLFKKKTISRYRIHDLLDDHFAENHDDSEDDDDELAYDTEESDDGIKSATKRRKTVDGEKKTKKKEVENNVLLQSYFAAIVVENVKPVYLKRSLVNELLKQPELFEEKVTGCFVRVKCDPNDYRARNSHKLMQVKGVKKVAIGENGKETFLLFSEMPKEICVSLLSDDNFSEEECKDLREKMLAGDIERPTVGVLQQKVKMLHEDITNHWISKELTLLRNRIDQANEKGWRRELFEYLDKQKRLQTPSERSRLLAEVPKVIPDIHELDSNSDDIIDDVIDDFKSDKLNELDSNSDDIIDDVKSDKGSSKSSRRCDSSVPEEKTTRNNRSASQSDKKKPMPENSASEEEEETQHSYDNITRSETLQVTDELKTEKLECKESLMHSRKVKDAPKTEVVDLLSDDDDDDDENASCHDDNKIPEVVVVDHDDENASCHDDNDDDDDDDASCHDDDDDASCHDDDDILEVDDDVADDDVANEQWCIRGPKGERDKCSWSVLKQWKSAYASKFKVWREDQSEEDAIWLHEAVRNAFSKK